MNLKQSIAIGLAVTAAFASFGCGGGRGTEGRTGSPQAASTQQKKPLDEATIKSLMKKLESSDIKDKQEACPLEKLPGYAMLKTPLLDAQAKVQNEYFSRKLIFGNLSVSEINQDGDVASARLSYTTAENKPLTERLYFARLDGKWYVDPLGLKTVKPLKASGDDERLEAAANLGYTYDNVPVFYLDVRSKTATQYSAGWVDPATFILITDKGEFQSQNTDYFFGPNSFVKVASASAAHFVLPFKGATGTPKALRIVGFNELDSRGLPLNHAHDDTVTFTFSE